MFDQPFSTRERLWLLGIRLVWQYRAHADAIVGLVDRLFVGSGYPACAGDIRRLLAMLEFCGADHLYIERYDESGVTGDERDLLRALKACYLDDTLSAESELGALLPPGRTDGVVDIMQRIATPKPRRAPARESAPALPDLSTAACH